MGDPVGELEHIATMCEMERPAWMVTGKDFLEVLRDMIIENGKSIIFVSNLIWQTFATKGTSIPRDSSKA